MGRVREEKGRHENYVNSDLWNYEKVYLIYDIIKIFKLQIRSISCVIAKQ